MKLTLSIAGAVLIATVAAWPSGAVAKIRCNGPWQIVQGNEIATPYCGDNYLASVARGYGSKVSAHAIRNNPNTKREICQFIGHDTRVQDICAGFRQDDGSHGGHR
ncbi:MAG: hypothetical protein KJ622_03485 [Alphaproteobacteria bacterium]|nr:hypothetical protein [Alphaproteobacteria bacterium]